jgi:hypothetical protein
MQGEPNPLVLASNLGQGWLKMPRTKRRWVSQDCGSFRIISRGLQGTITSLPYGRIPSVMDRHELGCHRL